MNERVRREVRELVDGFGPPSPGLAARATAGLPDRRGRTHSRWAAAAAAALAVATGALLWTAHGAARQVRTTTAGVAELQRRPLANVPLAGPACQVDARRATVVQTDATVTQVSGSGVPLDALVTIQTVYKPVLASTVGITAGPQVSGPVLVRGHRLDGVGTLSFALAPAPATRRELTLESGPRVRRWDVSVQASAAGCYAIQFDGARFSEQAVLRLWPYSGNTSLRTMDPAQARAAVRAAVTAARPVLLPAAVGVDWRAEVVTGADSFSVRYNDPADPTRSVVVGIAVANPPPPTGGWAQTNPLFHGDQHSLYEVNGSARILLWREQGAYDHADPSYPGVPYELTTTGLTDVEFWQIANSLG